MLDTILILILLISPIFTIAYCKRTIVEYNHMSEYLNKTLNSVLDELKEIHSKVLDDIPLEDCEDIKEIEV